MTLDQVFDAAHVLLHVPQQAFLPAPQLNALT
jgi:hypothetical protein